MGEFTAIAINRGNVIGTRSAHVGNLISNSGFEEGLAGWYGENVCPVGCTEPHEGYFAAGMGAVYGNWDAATLSQNVRFPSGLTRPVLLLVFYVAGVDDYPADLAVRLYWLYTTGRDEQAAVSAHVPRAAIGNGSRGKWNSYTLVTPEAPSEAVGAVLTFEKAAGRRRSNFLVLDDVLLIPLSGWSTN